MQQTVTAGSLAQYLQEELYVLGLRQESPLIPLQHIYTHKRRSVAFKLHFQRLWLNANTMDFLFTTESAREWFGGSGALLESIPLLQCMQANVHTRVPDSLTLSLGSCLRWKRLGDLLHLCGICVSCGGPGEYVLNRICAQNTKSRCVFTANSCWVRLGKGTDGAQATTDPKLGDASSESEQWDSQTPSQAPRPPSDLGVTCRFAMVQNVSSLFIQPTKDWMRNNIMEHERPEMMWSKIPVTNPAGLAANSRWTFKFRPELTVSPNKNEFL